MTIAFTERSYIRDMVRILVAVGASVLLLAACGGSGHHRAAPPPTKAGFAAAANAVCRTAGTHRVRIAGLRKLRPPDDERDLYGHWLSAERLAVEAGDVIAHRAKRQEVDPRVQLAVAEGKIAGYARRLGAVACTARHG
jgi:hypothetical protein